MPRHRVGGFSFSVVTRAETDRYSLPPGMLWYVPLLPLLHDLSNSRLGPEILGQEFGHPTFHETRFTADAPVTAHSMYMCASVCLCTNSELWLHHGRRLLGVGLVAHILSRVQ